MSDVFFSIKEVDYLVAVSFRRRQPIKWNQTLASDSKSLTKTVKSKLILDLEVGGDPYQNLDEDACAIFLGLTNFQQIFWVFHFLFHTPESFERGTHNIENKNHSNLL